MKKQGLMQRSDAAEYFGEFRTSEEGIFFYKNNAFFISDKIQGMLEVGGDRLKDVLLLESLGGLRWAPEKTEMISALEKKFLAPYDNLFFIGQKRLCEILSQYKPRVKKKGFVDFSCEDRAVRIIVNVNGEQTSVLVNLKLYSTKQATKCQNFHFQINAFLLDEIICNRFGSCDRIGMKFSLGTDIVFFNRNPKYPYQYWAVDQENIEKNIDV